MIEDKSERSAPLESPMKDRPAGPKDRETPSGLIYGRWYGGAEQDCPNRCAGLPEGMHVPPCPLNTSKRAEPEEVEQDADSE